MEGRKKDGNTIREARKITNKELGPICVTYRCEWEKTPFRPVNEIKKNEYKSERLNYVTQYFKVISWSLYVYVYVFFFF